MRRHPLTPAAALCGPAALKEGAHEVTLALRGSSLLVGVAEVETAPSIWPWRRRAWGMTAWDGQLVRCPTMLDGPLPPTGQTPAMHSFCVDEVTVTLRIDTVRRRVVFLRNGSTVGAHVCVPAAALCPWALFAPRTDAPVEAMNESVRLVSHTFRAVPTFNVTGLTELVCDLPPPKQALALAWCEARGVEDVGHLGGSGRALKLIESLNLPHVRANALLHRLETVVPSSSPPTYDDYH